MAKVFIFSDLYLCTFPFVELPLYHELKNRSIYVKYVLQKNDIRMSIAGVSDEYNKLDLIVINKINDVLKISSKGDLFILRFCYKGVGGQVADILRKNKRKILQYDVGGVDIRFRASPAQYLTSKSESLRKQALRKFPKHYKSIFTTGTIHYDAASTTEVNRDEFLKSYGLDVNKKLVILTPANPGEAWMTGLKDLYNNIVSIVGKKCPDYQIAVKCHPLDYMSGMPSVPGTIRKGQHYNDKQSWEELFPNITVIKANEGYEAIKACDAVLNVRSSIAMETALFRKPLININRSSYVTNWPFDSKIMMDIGVDDIVSVLNDNKYKVDATACEEYCKREAYSSDGKAYVRTADVIVKILSGKY